MESLAVLFIVLLAAGWTGIRGLRAYRGIQRGESGCSPGCRCRASPKGAPIVPAEAMLRRRASN